MNKAEDLKYNTVTIVDDTVLYKWNVSTEQNFIHAHMHTQQNENFKKWK